MPGPFSDAASGAAAGDPAGHEPEGVTVYSFLIQDNYVRLGKNSNVQDNSVPHVTPEFPCIVGDNVTIGHRAGVHACTIMDNVRIGIGAVVLNGAVVEEGAQVGAGALVPPGEVVQAGWLVLGAPAQGFVVDAIRCASLRRSAQSIVR